jgi:cytochrome b561
MCCWPCRWGSGSGSNVAGQSLNFFGLFSLASPFSADRNFAHQLEELHNLTAWALVYLVAAHAGAALVHRYVLRDGVLKRMLPVTG